VRIWNLDAHAAVITDVKKQLGELGNQVDSWNLTGHYWTQNLPQRTSWRGFKTDFIWDYSPEKCKEEHGEHLAQYDANLVCYPPLMVRLFDRIEKPMIQYLPVRYDLWTTDVRSRWESYHQWFMDRTREKRLYVAANSLYDVYYCKYFTGLEPAYIPSICDYVGVQYAPENRPPLLWDSRSEKISHLFMGEINGLQTPRGYYSGRYEWANLVKHKAIIHVPYNASIMSFFEHYWMNIPLFVPTREYMMELKRAYGAIGEITHNQCANHAPPGSFVKNGTFNAPDPNEYDDIESLLFWSQWWDMYTMPHITYFSSIQDLREKLLTVDLQKISMAMKEHNKVRKASALRKWAEFIGGVK
jgi:hypothetical protein